MSLTTTSKRSASSIGSRASAASAAEGPVSEPGGGGGKVSYSSAAVKATPAPSTASRQCSQVSTVTRCPRPESARASAIAGNACPASPKAATRNLQDPFPDSRRALTTGPMWRTIVAMRRRSRDPARRLRLAVERLPRRTKEAMLRGIDCNRIIVGAYVDPTSGGVCPMLAAHRNGGRTDVAAFARAWDEYTDARRPRRASRREVSTLRSLLEASLDLDTSLDRVPIAILADQIRAERRQRAGHIELPAPEPVSIPEPDASPIRIHRRAPSSDLLTATERELTGP